MVKNDSPWIRMLKVINFIFSTAIAYQLVYGENEIRLCPTVCSCRVPCDSSSCSLNIVCSGRKDEFNSASLAEEIDEMLQLPENILQHYRVTSLTIQGVPLSTFPMSICQLTNLTSLRLNNNNLKRLPDKCITKLTRLTSFDAAWNRLFELQDGLFDGLQQLQTINLRNNEIARIGLKVFSNVSDLSSLSKISINNNRLTTVDTWPFVRGLTAFDKGQGAPVEVDLSSNLISNFTNKIGWRFNCSDKKYPIASISLAFNKVKRLSDFVKGYGIKDFLTVFCLFTGHKVVIDLLRNHLICDCEDFQYMHILYVFQYAGLFHEVYCDSPLELAHTEILRVPLDKLVCDVRDDCPPTCHCVYRPNNATMHIYCSSSNLTTLPARLPPLPHKNSVYYIDVSGNSDLRSLDYRDYLNKTAVFFGSNSGVAEIDERVWRSFLVMKLIHLNRCRLAILPQVDIDMNASYLVHQDVRKLSLGSNPWSCSCEDKAIKTLLTALDSHQLLMSTDDMLCESPSRLRGKNVLRLSHEEFCVDPLKWAITITASTFGSAVLLIAVLCLFAFNARVWLHSRWKLHPFDRDECSGEEMDYDVFLCCSSEDDIRHGRPILNLLEDHGYRVHYHLRDFPAGELIENNIIQAVVRSRRTLCLISSHFLSSAHCLREFDVALHHNVTLRRARRLIVMFLDSPRLILDGVDDVDTLALRQYVREYTYIDGCESGGRWVDKLLYAMPLRGLGPVDAGVFDWSNDLGDVECILIMDGDNLELIDA